MLRGVCVSTSIKSAQSSVYLETLGGCLQVRVCVSEWVREGRGKGQMIQNCVHVCVEGGGLHDSFGVNSHLLERDVTFTDFLLQQADC